jgi:peptidoglycan hydrolase-like protein with peptidoglycan-binding domain
MNKKPVRTLTIGTVVLCVLLFAAITSTHTFAATRTVAATSPLMAANHACPQTVRAGSVGEAVVTLQVELSWIFGYSNVQVNGRFDAQTDAAVRDFQSKHALPVTGVVGPITWHALGEC